MQLVVANWLKLSWWTDQMRKILKIPKNLTRAIIFKNDIANIQIWLICYYYKLDYTMRLEVKWEKKMRKTKSLMDSNLQNEWKEIY